MQTGQATILLINDHIHFGGGGDATFRRERDILTEAGFDVHTFSHALKHPEDAGVNDHIHVESKSNLIRKMGKYLFNFSLYLKLRKLLKKLSPDVIHLHLPSRYPSTIYAALGGYRVYHTLHGPSLFCATSWGCLKKDSSYCELGTGLKCFVRGCVPLWQLPLVCWNYGLCRYFARRSIALYLGPSRQICRAAERVGFKPARYFPLCVDPHFSGEPADVEKNEPAIIYVGAIAEVKGVHILLDAFRIIHATMPEAKLVYAGRGDMLEWLKKRTGEYGLADHVEFLGFVDHDQIPDVYRRGRVFVLPSIWAEQFGLVGPEAFVCGLPCVATDIGGIGEWLDHNQSGYLVAPRDTQALAEKLMDLLEHPRKGKRFAQYGSDCMATRFSPEQFSKNILELFHSKNEIHKD